jgi:Flp pilus assembly protein CpaB
MRGGSKLFIIAGIGLGLVAVLLIVSSMGGGGGTNAKTDSDKIMVVQAANDIPAHNILQPEDLVTKEMPTDQVPADAVRSVAEVVGKSYRVPLAPTQTLVASQVEQPGLKNDIAVGKRAIAVPVDEKNLFAGLIQDNDYVDLVFHARINEVRILPTNLAETPEDEPYYKYDSKGSGENNGNNNEEQNQEDEGSLGETSGGTGVMWVPPGLEIPQHPATGDAGSQLFVRDDTGELQQLEPVAKVMVQDVRVLRVVRPGESYGADGQPTESDTSGLQSGEETGTAGYVVLEVSADQAEVLTFMQDKRHEYQVVVRGKDDHEHVDTKGVTFEILYQDSNYKMPLPGSVKISSKKK